MKFFTIVAVTSAFPGGILSVLWPEVAQSAGNAAHSFNSLFPAGTWTLKQPGQVVKSIGLLENVAIPFNELERQRWSAFADDTISARKLVKWFLPDTHAEMMNPDSEDVGRLLKDLATYVEESKRDRLGRVKPSTDRNARLALLQLIAVQNSKNRLLPANHWELPEFALKRLKLILKNEKEAAGVVAKN